MRLYSAPPLQLLHHQIPVPLKTTKNGLLEKEAFFLAGASQVLAIAIIHWPAVFYDKKGHVDRGCFSRLEVKEYIH